VGGVGGGLLRVEGEGVGGGVEGGGVFLFLCLRRICKDPLTVSIVSLSPA
jgi:hypothetical protein